MKEHKGLKSTIVILAALTVITIFIAVTFSSLEWSLERKKYTKVCEEAGGVAHSPRNTGLWPELVCINRDVFIDLKSDIDDFEPYIE
jgi:hypothetical protein